VVLKALRGGQVDFHERFQADHSDDVRALPWLSEIASALYAPLIAAGQPFGLLVAAWREPRRPDPELLALADALAGCAAVAVHTARLLAESQRASAELERLVATVADSARLDGAIKTARLVAHELNNQLSPIRGYSEVLTEMLEGLTQRRLGRRRARHPRDRELRVDPLEREPPGRVAVPPLGRLAP